MPVVLFMLLGLFFLAPLFPTNWQLLYQLQQLDTQGVIIFTFLTIIMTGLLYNLNIPIIRLYEGYPWRNSFVGRWLTRYYQSQLHADAALRSHAQLLREAPQQLNEIELPSQPSVESASEIQKSKERQAALQEIRQARIQAGQRLVTIFPRDAEAVLPTGLGNVIRSFEHYPQRQYKMASITLWPRLVAKIDKDYAVAIDDAKTSFDFFINCSVLSAILALMILFVGLIYPTSFVSARLSIPWIFEIVFFVVLAYVAYLLSIGRASAWGDMVKGAFDLYRWDLLKQLGYKVVPSTMEEERNLWAAISRQLIYGDLPKTRLPEYDKASPPALGNPYTVSLEVGRGVSLPDKDGTIRINLHIKNVDPQNKNVTEVVVKDTLPDGYHYVWTSASMAVLPVDEDFPDYEIITATQKVHVTGSNPYYFHVGDLEAGEGLYLSYLVIQYPNCGGNNQVKSA